MAAWRKLQLGVPTGPGELQFAVLEFLHFLEEAFVALLYKNVG